MKMRKMSRYHSICETCGMEDPNDGTLDHDCGHPFWAIVDHIEEGHDDEEETCDCLGDAKCVEHFLEELDEE